MKGVGIELLTLYERLASQMVHIICVYLNIVDTQHILSNEGIQQEDYDRDGNLLIDVRCNRSTGLDSRWRRAVFRDLIVTK